MCGRDQFIIQVPFVKRKINFNQNQNIQGNRNRIITLHYPDALWKWNEIHFNAGHREPFPSPSHVLNQHYPVSIQFQYVYTFFFYQKSLYKYPLYNKASAAFKLQIKSQKFIPNKAISYD